MHSTKISGTSYFHLIFCKVGWKALLAPYSYLTKPLAIYRTENMKNVKRRSVIPRPLTQRAGQVRGVSVKEVNRK